MRHMYIRLTLGLLFAVCTVYSFVVANISFALLYLFLSVMFLGSACSLWKNDRQNRR